MAAVIPVAPQPEPTTFDSNVRRPGRAWLKARGVPPKRRLPAGAQLKAYWRRTAAELHAVYGGVCAYACVFLERPLGGVSTDHFVAKSRRLSLAYEWSNYRLACLIMNARKTDYETVLDPFTLSANTFHLELVSGRIYPNPRLARSKRDAAQTTIDVLELDDPTFREMRARHYAEYVAGEYDAVFLRKRSPFVWTEADRQGLL